MKHDVSWTKLKFGQVFGKTHRRRLYGIDSWKVQCGVCGTIFVATLAHIVKCQGACALHEAQHAQA